MMGAPPEVISQLKSAVSGELFAVFPENWDVVQLFMRVQTQWTYSASGTALGLNYTGVDVAMKRLRIDDPFGDIFSGLQVMEYAALDATRD